jgi:hypothetical protein
MPGVPAPGGSQTVPTALATPDRWLARFGQQVVYAQADAGQPSTSSSVSLDVFHAEHDTERQAVEQAERPRQQSRTQSDDRHDPMVPGRNRTSPLIRTRANPKCHVAAEIALWGQNVTDSRIAP